MQDKKSKYSITLGEYAANVRKEDGYSDIREAIEYGDIDAVKRFIKEGADIHALSVIALAKSHNGKMLQFLIEQGADIFQEEEGLGRGIMHYVVHSYGSDIDRYKEGDKPNREWDRFSSEQDIHNKYLGIIKVLAGHGYDVNKPVLSHFTPLQLAMCVRVVPELAFYLVEECGADVNCAGVYDIEKEYKEYTDDAKKHRYEPVSIDEFKECRPSSPLKIASQLRPGEVSFEICKLLVRHGADVNYISLDYDEDGPDEWSPLCAAIEFENIPVVQLLIESGADVNLTMRGVVDESDERSPLLMALHEGSIPIIKLLLENGADVNCAGVYDIEKKYKEYTNDAEIHGYDPVSIDEFKKCRPSSPLMRACCWDPGEESFEVCKLFVRHGADVNYISLDYWPDEWSPLCYAIGNIPVMQLLIENGADVNLTMRCNEDFNGADERSPLLVALQEENIPSIKLLLENGAEITDSIREYVDGRSYNDEIRELFGM